MKSVKELLRKKMCIEGIMLILCDGQNSIHAEDDEAVPPHAYTTLHSSNPMAPACLSFFSPPESVLYLSAHRFMNTCGLAFLYSDTTSTFQGVHPMGKRGGRSGPTGPLKAPVAVYTAF